MLVEQYRMHLAGDTYLKVRERKTTTMPPVARVNCLHYMHFACYSGRLQCATYISTFDFLQFFYPKAFRQLVTMPKGRGIQLSARECKLLLFLGAPVLLTFSCIEA